MMARYWIHSFPFWAMPRDQPPAILVGETLEEVAWSFVDLHHEHPDLQPAPQGLFDTGVVMISAYSPPSPMHFASELEEARYSEAWWEGKRVRTLARVGASDGIAVAEFKRLFPLPRLLTFWLAQILGECHVRDHGLPSGPITPEGVLAYLEELTYLEWVENLQQVLTVEA
jgi:hypothetical protein